MRRFMTYGLVALLMTSTFALTSCGESDEEKFEREMDKAIEEFEKEMDDVRMTHAIIYVNEVVNRTNKYIDETMPWALAKDEAKKEELQSVMLHLANTIYIAGMLLKPVLVHASDKLFEQLGVSDLSNYENIYKYGIVENHTVSKGEQLFPRLDVETEVQFIKELMGENK